MGKPQKKQGQLVVYDSKRRTKMYRVRHHIVKDRFVYAGQTVDEEGRKRTYRSAALRDRTKTDAKRAIQANKKKNPLMVEYVTELLLYGLPLLLETCPEFPNGVPHERADGFEALMIHDLETGANEKHGYGKNTSLGNNLAEHLPRFAEYRAELAASGGVYVWSEEDEAMSRGQLPLPVPEPPQVTDAEMKADALLDMRDDLLDAEVSDEVIEAIDERIKGALVVVEDARRQCLGPLALAEHLSSKYAAQLITRPVDAEEFACDLNALRDRINEGTTPNANLLAVCRAVGMIAKRTVTARFVAAQFNALATAIEAVEDAALPDRLAVSIMKDARDMMTRTGVPKVRAAGEGVTKEETCLMYRLKQFKARNKDSVDATPMRFVLRSNQQWLAWFDSWWYANNTESSIKMNAIVNSMLLAGHAHPREPEFEGWKKWPNGARHSEAVKIYTGMNNLLYDIKNNTASVKRLEASLAGLKDKWPERDAWWRSGGVCD